MQGGISRREMLARRWSLILVLAAVALPLLTAVVGSTANSHENYAVRNFTYNAFYVVVPLSFTLILVSVWLFIVSAGVGAKKNGALGARRCRWGRNLGIASIFPYFFCLIGSIMFWRATMNHTDNWGAGLAVAFFLIAASVVSSLFGIPSFACSISGLRMIDRRRDRQAFRAGVSGLILGGLSTAIFVFFTVVLLVVAIT